MKLLIYQNLDVILMKSLSGETCNPCDDWESAVESSASAGVECKQLLFPLVQKYVVIHSLGDLHGLKIF